MRERERKNKCKESENNGKKEKRRDEKAQNTFPTNGEEVAANELRDRTMHASRNRNISRWRGFRSR